MRVDLSPRRQLSIMLVQLTLGQMIFMGEASLRYVLHQYLSHYHTERHHQGLDNHLIAPEVAVGRQRGQVVRRKRLGGLLSYYYREAA